MKRLSTFLVLFLIVFSSGLHAAKNTLVTSAAELQNAWGAATDGDTIFCAPGTYSVGTNLKFPLNLKLVVKSQYSEPDSIAILVCDIGQPTPDVSGQTFTSSLIFENMHLQQRTGAYGSSGHIIYLNKFDGILNIDELIFRNCIISNSPRGLIRTVVSDATDANGDPVYSSCGDIEYFEMSNCMVSDIFVTSGNNWPLVYLSHIPVEMYFTNNTFYNMPYMKNIFTMNYADPESGRSSKIYIENNTVATTMAGNYFDTGAYLGEEAEWYLNNNVFILPNWTDEFNNDPEEEKYTIPAIVRCKYGMIFTENNLVEGPKSWEDGQIIDEDGEGGFLVLETENTYTMESLGISWDDFADPKNGDYSFLSSSALATAGTDGGPIGDARWLKDFSNPRTLIASANIEEAKVIPLKGYYEDGDEVTVTASEVDGATFLRWINVADNAELSTENPYKFTITSDMEIQAIYSVLEPREVEITIEGSNSASYIIDPEKEIYYVGDQITISLNGHYINDFLGWSDGSYSLTRTINIENDVILTASFREYDYIVAWDFCQLTGNNQTFEDLAANHAADDSNVGIMNYYNMEEEAATISTRNNKFTGDGQELIYCAARRTHEDRFSDPDYLYIEFSTQGHTNVRVSSVIATDNSIFQVQKMQYSLDGNTYTDFATYEVNKDEPWLGTWMRFTEELPAAAVNQDKVYVRWIADTGSERLFAEGSEGSDTEFLYIGKIIVFDNDGYTSVKDVETGNTYAIYAADGKLYIESEIVTEAEVYNIMGRKESTLTLSAGLNQISGISSGVYIVRIGSTIQKVLIK